MNTELVFDGNRTGGPGHAAREIMPGSTPAAPLAVLMANKYFFDNGGSETVYFQERDFLLRSGMAVVDFSMKHERNRESPFADHFVDNRDYRNNRGGLSGRFGTAAGLIHSAEATRRVRALIERERPDILHAHNIYHQLTPSIFRTAKAMGVRTVLTLHDFKVVCPIYNRIRGGKDCTACETGAFVNVVRHRCADGSFGKSVLLYAEAEFHRLMGSYDAVDRVIAPSRYCADAVTRWRFPSEKVTVIPNGVDVDRIRPVWDDDGYLLYMGRLTAGKGLDVLGRAMQGSGHRVVVAGTGPLADTLRREFPDLELVGHLSGAVLAETVQRAAAVVVPSEVSENCPMSVLEAMAAGKPVVASRVGGIPELVTHGDTGYLCKPGCSQSLRDLTVYLLNDKRRRIQMGRNARLVAEELFSLERHNQAVLQVYRSVL